VLGRVPALGKPPVPARAPVLGRLAAGAEGRLTGAEGRLTEGERLTDGLERLMPPPRDPPPPPPRPPPRASSSPDAIRNIVSKTTNSETFFMTPPRIESDRSFYLV
jgi:hypothetical protein